MLRIQQVSASKPHSEIGCPDLSISLSFTVPLVIFKQATADYFDAILHGWRNGVRSIRKSELCHDLYQLL